MLDPVQQIVGDVLLPIDGVHSHSHRTTNHFLHRWRLAPFPFGDDGKLASYFSKKGGFVLIELDIQFHRRRVRVDLDCRQCVHHKNITVNDQEPTSEEERKDLTLEDLETLDSIVELGRLAVSLLKSFGTAAFLIDEQGQVRTANPYMVFFDGQMAHPPEGVEPEFVRPILTNSRPQFVAKKPDGSLWEVEYPRPELEDLTPSILEGDELEELEDDEQRRN